MATPEKILVRGVNWLGDAVMTTPGLQRLREAKPDARITLLTPKKLADLWRGHPSLNETLSFDERENVFGVAKRLRAERFDCAVVLPNSLRSALEVFLAGIPRRIGYARGGRRFLLTDALPPRDGAVKMRKRSVEEIKARIASGVARETFPNSAHHVHDYLQLTAALGANPAPLPPLLEVGEAEIADVCARFQLDKARPIFALNPGAEYGPAKRWPVELFADAAVELSARGDVQWLVLGGRADQSLAAELVQLITTGRSGAMVANAAGETSLRELCALLKACALLITNDTGPMHVAAAVGTPVVVPFGSTAPELTGPAFSSPSPHTILIGAAACAPCFLRECPVDFRCLKSVSAMQVVQAARSVMAARS